MPEEIIRLEDVTFRYFEKGKRNILDHVNLSVMSGITVVAGASGCGKSTLAAVISGLYPENGGYLETGKITLYGHALSSMNAPQRSFYLSVLFQNPSLQFCMDTLRHEMEFCLENLSVPKEKMADRIDSISHDLHVERLLDQKLQSLSGGEMQKAELACLFLIGSRCIIMDEPFANIDEPQAKEIISMMLKKAEEGTSFLIIDHRMDYWLQYADEIILMGHGGKVLQRQVTKDNFHDSASIIEKEGLYFPPITAYPRFESVFEQKEDPAIVLQHLTISKNPSKKHPSHSEEKDLLLKDASALFQRGEMSAVIGPSGAGKTTLFLSMLKCHRYEGEILYDGKNLNSIKEKELYRHAGIVFQNPANQFISQKVMDEVEQSLRIWNPKMDEKECEKQSLELLQEYGLEHYWKYSPYMLSQGQQRRLAVLSVLCGKQKILFLDEPTYGQDFRSTMAIMDQLKQKMKNEGLTVIFISHDLKLAESYADCIYYLKDKKLVQKKGERG